MRGLEDSFVDLFLFVFDRFPHGNLCFECLELVLLGYAKGTILEVSPLRVWSSALSWLLFFLPFIDLFIFEFILILYGIILWGSSSKLLLPDN